MTVSRAINASCSIRPETQAKVEEAVRELGYVPNRAARSLAGGRQSRIALVHSNPSAGYRRELLVGAVAQANASNVQLSIEQWEKGDTVAQFVARQKAHQIDGILLPPPLCEDAALIHALHSARIRIVQISPSLPNPLAHALTIEDINAARAITAHLVELGHVRIGFIEGSATQSQSALRRAGYETALREAGIALEPDLIVPGDFSYRSGLVATERLLAIPHQPTAIFASNDEMAAAAVAIVHRHRLDVPTDISVCGFDDTAMATTIWPELTTIRQPIAKMAKAGIKLLCRSSDAQADEPRLYCLPVELIVRASSGPPSAD